MKHHSVRLVANAHPPERIIVVADEHTLGKVTPVAASGHFTNLSLAEAEAAQLNAEGK